MTATGPPEPQGAEWAEIAASAPELAARVRARFESNRHHVLGTVRANGAPRLSGTEVRVDERAVSLGMMPASRKLADVRRDPRVEIHSAPLEEDLAQGDAKLAGRLVEVSGEPPHGEGTFFELAIELVSLVRVAHDQLVFTSWRPGRGVNEVRRS